MIPTSTASLPGKMELNKLAARSDARYPEPEFCRQRRSLQNSSRSRVLRGESLCEHWEGLWKGVRGWYRARIPSNIMSSPRNRSELCQSFNSPASHQLSCNPNASHQSQPIGDRGLPQPSLSPPLPVRLPSPPPLNPHLRRDPRARKGRESFPAGSVSLRRLCSEYRVRHWGEVYELSEAHCLIHTWIIR